jgi:glycosyltransferase involved in cell wall biosynthesis
MVPQTSPMPPLTATIIALNEARHTARAIRSLSFADEVLVVDSGSSDGTQELALKLGARVLHHAWAGYSAQKNFAASQARFDWILSLDADEELNPAAQETLRQWMHTEPLAAGYRFARRPFYLGRWITHSGWYPDFKPRLYDRRRGAWQGDFVHEALALEGGVETLPGEILHYTFDTLEEHYRTIERYTDLAAQEMLAGGQRPGLAARVLGPPWKFFATWVLAAGFLDGPQGWQIARAAAHYVRRRNRKCMAMQR